MKRSMGSANITKFTINILISHSPVKNIDVRGTYDEKNIQLLDNYFISI